MKNSQASLKKKLFILFVLSSLCYGLIFFITIYFIKVPLLLIIAIVLTNSILFIIFNIFFVKNMVLIYKKISDISKGKADLTQRLPVLSSDEIGNFNKKINIFIAHIHNIIFKLKNISNESKELSENLAASTHESSTAIEEMTATIDSIANNGKKLEISLKASLSAIEDIGKSIVNIVASINTQTASVNQSSSIIEQMVSSLQDITNISRSKMDFIEILKNQAKDSEKNMAVTLESIKKITDSIDIIKDLVEVINNIASQTNVLSINAAIESAHAGKYGKGFSVIASEINKLAVTTSNNAKSIAKNLNMIISNIKSAYDLTLNTGDSIKNMTTGVQDFAHTISDIIENLGKVSSGTDEITDSLSSLISITEDVKNISNEINLKSESIHSSINDVVDISSNNTHALNEINIGMNQLLEATSIISVLGTKNSNNIDIMVDDISNFNIIDTSNLLSSDGQPLIQWNKKQKQIPARPDNPENYPEDDEKHWYDIEYAGWNIKKVNIPETPADGSFGKRVICLRANHPYQDAYQRGMEKIANSFGINLETYIADYDSSEQNRQINKAIKEKPDMIIVNPVNADKCIDWCQRINQAKIPVILSNSAPANNEGYKYIISWTGPDDWGQCRALAKKFAELMNYKGGYCCIRHFKESSNYIARTYSFITELRKIAPKMECLDMKSTQLNNEITKETVLEWINIYGNKLNGIISADDSGTMLGANVALEKAGRNDIIRVGIGHCKIGLDGVKEGRIHAITFQSAEGDGALAIESAIDWFNGLEIVPIKYLTIGIITKENVESYYPAQW